MSGWKVELNRVNQWCPPDLLAQAILEIRDVITAGGGGGGGTDDLEKRLASLEHKVELMNNKLVLLGMDYDYMKKKWNEHLTYIDEQILSAFQKITDMANQLTSVATQVTQVFERITYIDEKLVTVFEQITNITEQLVQITKSVTDVTNLVTTISNQITQLTNSVAEVTNLVTQLHTTVTDLGNRIDLLANTVKANTDGIDKHTRELGRTIKLPSAYGAMYQTNVNHYNAIYASLFFSTDAMNKTDTTSRYKAEIYSLLFFLRTLRCPFSKKFIDVGNDKIDYPLLEWYRQQESQLFRWKPQQSPLAWGTENNNGIYYFFNPSTGPVANSTAQYDVDKEIKIYGSHRPTFATR